MYKRQQLSRLAALAKGVLDGHLPHCPTPMRQVAVEDSFGESGKPAQLMEKYGLNAKAIEAQVEDVMRTAPAAL